MTYNSNQSPNSFDAEAFLLEQPVKICRQERPSSTQEESKQFEEVYGLKLSTATQEVIDFLNQKIEKSNLPVTPLNVRNFLRDSNAPSVQSESLESFDFNHSNQNKIPLMQIPAVQKSVITHWEHGEVLQQVLNIPNRLRLLQTQQRGM